MGCQGMPKFGCIVGDWRSVGLGTRGWLIGDVGVLASWFIEGDAPFGFWARIERLSMSMLSLPEFDQV